ncbi:MAG: hypothetical protein K0Q92_2140 [Steroidobacteraceae bacterium]|nr:hypothetical protein [Steroidobacteraceae bacterium]
MRRALVGVVLAAAALGVAAQNLPPAFPAEEVLVIVWKDGGRCSVLDRKTHCSRVASLLAGSLQVGRDRSIVVAAQTADSEVQIRAAQVMSDIRSAGYRNVRPALSGR